MFPSGGDRPDLLVPVAGHDVENLHLSLHHVGVGLAEPGQSRTASEDVVAVDDPVTAEPVVALVENRGSQLPDLGALPQRTLRVPKDLLHDHVGQHPVAVVEQVDAVEGQRGGVFPVELLRGGEEVHEGGLAGGTDFLHRLGVHGQVTVVVAAVGKVGALEVFVGDG